MSQIIRGIKGILLGGGLFVLSQLPPMLMLMKKSIISELLLATITVLAVGAFIFIAKKRGYFHTVEKEFSKKNIGIIFMAFILMWIIAIVFKLIMQETTKNQQVIQDVTANISIVNLFLMLCIGAPIMEEIIFRGVIMNEVFRGANNQKISSNMEIIGLIISSILFSSTHLSANFSSFLMYMALGVCMGGTYLLTKSLKCSIALHFLNNFLSFLVLAFSR